MWRHRSCHLPREHWGSGVPDSSPTHSTWDLGSNSNPSLKGHLHHPTDIDRPLNEVVTDKILTYRVDYINPFWLVQEFIMDNPTSSITVTQCSSHRSSLKSVIFSPRCHHGVLISILMTHRWILVRTLSVTHPSHSQTSPFNIVSIFRYPRPPLNPVYTRSLDPSVLPCSLSLHRHPYLCILFNLSLSLGIPYPRSTQSDWQTREGFFFLQKKTFTRIVFTDTQTQ